MLDTDTKRRIDTARDILVGKVPDPKSQVEQITIALIYKFMDDMDAESEELGGKRKFFAKEFARYGWAKLMRSGLGGHETLNLYAEAITKMPENPGIPLLFRDIFKNAYLPYRDPETLRSFLKIIDEFHYDHSERLGDAFEYLLSILGSQGDAGQFRTPRHIIDFMVAVIDPKKNESVLDPACGTAGFLISSYKHILKANTDTKGNSTLTPDEKGRLAANFKGYDISPDMVRLSLVNLYLHGFTDPHIYEYDTLTSQDRWSDYADVVLANPPFMSPKGGIKPHNRFSVQSKRSEVLFVDYMAEHLTPNGRAGIIVPEGIIFQSQTAYKQLRKMLVEEYLVAVISLPAGVFNPYSGVKTSILILDKSLAKKASTIAFFKIENDGFGLGAQRREIDKNDLPQARSEIAEYLHHLRSGKSVEDFKPSLGLVVPKEKISANGDYNLSAERYREGNVWRSAFPLRQFEDVCTLEYGEALPKDERIAGPYPVVGSNGITGYHNDYLVEGPVIIVGRKGSAGEVTLIEQHCFPIDTTYYVKQTNPSESNIIFLYWVLRSMNLPDLRGGAGIPGLNRSDVYGAHQIPLPPLDVQNEIVAEIDGYQKVINGARAVVDNYRPHIPIHRNPASIDVHARLLAALETFRWRDSKLIELGCNERSMTAKIAGYLQEKFPEWDVDHEYNRDGKDPKKRADGSLTTPDIIIHRRGTTENFVVIEVKKTGGQEDLLRLDALAGGQGYEYAFTITIDGTAPAPEWVKCRKQPDPTETIHSTLEWPMVELGEVCTIRSGGTPSRSEPNYWNGTIPWVTTTLINYNTINRANEFITEDGLKNSSAWVVPKGTVLMAMYGEGVTRGRVAILGIDAAVNQACAAFTPKDDSVDPAFLYRVLQSQYENLRSVSDARGGNQSNLSSQVLKQCEIPLPPLVIQQAIVAEIEAEQTLIAANRELIARFEKKIQATLARVWGADLGASAM